MKRSAAAMAHADQQEGGGDTEQWRTFESHKFFVATNDRNVKEAMRRCVVFHVCGMLFAYYA